MNLISRKNSRENEKFTVTENFFRQINSLVTSKEKHYFHEIFSKDVCDISILITSKKTWFRVDFTEKYVKLSFSIMYID